MPTTYVRRLNLKESLSDVEVTGCWWVVEDASR